MCSSIYSECVQASNSLSKQNNAPTSADQLLIYAAYFFNTGLYSTTKEINLKVNFNNTKN